MTTSGANLRVLPGGRSLPGRGLPDPVRRAVATQATLNRFVSRQHRLSTVDCGRMIGFHLRKMGHVVDVPKMGDYSTYAGALKWLKKRGFETLEDQFDHLLVRIKPAEALVGDIMTLESDGALSAPVVYLGGQRCLGFHEQSDRCEILTPSAFLHAWRVI